MGGKHLSVMTPYITSIYNVIVMLSCPQNLRNCVSSWYFGIIITIESNCINTGFRSNHIDGMMQLALHAAKIASLTNVL